jgi:hypothetical protein
MVSRGDGRFWTEKGGLLSSLREINRLPAERKEKIYRDLIPAPLFDKFQIDRGTFCGQGGLRQVRFVCPQQLGILRIEVRLNPRDRDSIFFVELADTPYRQIELSFCLINDPRAPRFNIDVDESGRDNFFGTVRRNIPEEVKAMKAGLSPNQVCRGMKIFSDFFARLERFVDSLGLDTIVAEPLSYNNAVRYEKYGFDYVAGKQLMLWINREFHPGGILFRRLDGSTPFRQQGMEKTVRGRSWAIHDGILGRPWDGVKIYKVLGRNVEVDTFSDREF